MKNKKGFTLVELLVVIVLLVVITGSTILGIDEISESVRKKRLEEVLKQIQMAADVYYSNNEVHRSSLLNGEVKTKCTRIYVLQNEGLLKTDLINPRTNERIPANLCVNSHLNDEGIIIHEFTLD